MSEQRLAGPAIVIEEADQSATTRVTERQRFSFFENTLTLTHGLVLTMLLAGVFGFWHLDRYPRTWFDEGSYLEVSENIFEHGQYFAQAPNGARDFAPVIAAGPTVLLPAAAAQAILGSTLWAGRLVGVVYLIIGSAAIYWLAGRLFGVRAAVASIALLFSMPALDWLGTGRQLLGETPALLFLVVGGGLAFRANSAKAAALAGVVLGLAMITKGQYLLVLPPVLVLVAAFDFFGQRVRPLRWHAALTATAALAYVVWFIVLLNLIGDGSILENYRQLRDTSNGALLVFNVDRMRAAWTLLLGPRSLFLVLPSVAYGLNQIRKAANPARRLALISISTFQVCWLVWFAMASIAWPRYAFPALAVSTIYAGVMVTDLLGWRLAGLRREERASVRRSGAELLLFGVIGLLVAAGAYRQIAPIFTADESEPQSFAAAMDRVVPAGAVVDGWEPEINFLSERELQYPPNGSLDRVVRAAWLGSSDKVDLSSTLSQDYLVVGHFGNWVGVYQKALDSGDYRLILSQDGFELYERTQAP
jgi:4-amino-4-deoxy-L-arabinose transferase-like glycosyltransferase